MRIAILTLPLHTNYGGILQCYALQTVLERMGHKVKVLDKPLYNRRYYIYWGLAILKRLIKKFILLRPVISILYAPYQIERNIVRKYTNRYIKKYIHKYSRQTWNSSLAKRFDVFVVGSDQVWRPEYAIDIYMYFLSFLGESKTKRISYAASFGLDNLGEYTESQIQKCASLLKKFDAVSVREDSAVKLCKEYFGIDAVQMLDPTLLLTADDYIKLFENGTTVPSDGHLLVYMLDKNKDKESLCDCLASEQNLIPFWLDSPDENNKDLPIESRTKMSVEQWLRSFYDTNLVLTDSFHGCVFSVIFHKPFVVVGNSGRGLTRVESLLDLLDLKERLVFSSSDLDSRKDTLLGHIDYSAIDTKLRRHRESALAFLKCSISK